MKELLLQDVNVPGRGVRKVAWEPQGARAVACGLWLSVCSAICEDLGLGLALPGALAHALPLAWLLAFFALPDLLLTPSPCHLFLPRCLCICGGVFAIYRFLACRVFAA